MKKGKKVSVPGFQQIPHPSDIGLEAFGKNLEQAFEQAAAGLFSLMTGAGQIKIKETKKIKVTGADEKELLVNWLNELIFLFETQHWIPGRFFVKITAPFSLTAEIGGEKIDSRRHKFVLEIKAATYNKLAIKKEKDCTWVRVVFDV